jgi:DNA gyrase/topoisomerase IV subunit B
MNERIKELIESLGIIPEDEHYEIAKLIVEECIIVVDRDDGATHVKELLMEHFGVEE